LAAHHGSSEQKAADNSPSEYEAYHKVHVVGLLNFLSAIRIHSSESKLFYAASSLVFDGANGPIQDEKTPFTPVGFYGLTKSQGILVCREFRERYGVFAASGILYNHESALRAERFLSKKLIASAHQISLGNKDKLVVGSLSAATDWGYAPDFVLAFQHVLSVRYPDDYIVATGEAHSVADFAQIAFECFGLDYTDYVYENSNLLGRHLPRKVGDSSKLKKATGWRPSRDFPGMVRTLVGDYLSSYATGIIADVSVEAKPA
jgi:GDPmannose 4,6-dehydratase